MYELFKPKKRERPTPKRGFLPGQALHFPTNGNGIVRGSEGLQEGSARKFPKNGRFQGRIGGGGGGRPLGSNWYLGKEPPCGTG